MWRLRLTFDRGRNGNQPLPFVGAREQNAVPNDTGRELVESAEVEILHECDYTHVRGRFETCAAHRKKSQFPV